jgi:hypothetical protein
VVDRSGWSGAGSPCLETKATCKRDADTTRHSHHPTSQTASSASCSKRLSSYWPGLGRSSAVFLSRIATRCAIPPRAGFG